MIRGGHAAARLPASGSQATRSALLELVRATALATLAALAILFLLPLVLSLA
jgi:hypothetical protein